MDHNFGLDNGTQYFYPGTSTQTFHNYSSPVGGEDDWSSDSSGVSYYQLYGVQSTAQTIGQVSPVSFPVCILDNLLESMSCNPINLFAVSFIDGDGTVPTLSATGVMSSNSSSSSAQIVPFVYPSASILGDFNVSHIGIFRLVRSRTRY